jgi:hypothetical protein
MAENGWKICESQMLIEDALRFNPLEVRMITTLNAWEVLGQQEQEKMCTRVTPASYQHVLSVKIMLTYTRLHQKKTFHRKQPFYPQGTDIFQKYRTNHEPKVKTS